jgi:cytochrome bd-type quinol oxidase subunit 2
LQALIYVAVILLTRRNNPWGFGAGVVVPTAWNCLGLFITHLIQGGAIELWTALHTGHISQPDRVTVLLGGLAHFLLIIACIAGFLQLHPGRKQWAQFFGGGLVAMAYFALIIVTTAPR